MGLFDIFKTKKKREENASAKQVKQGADETIGNAGVMMLAWFVCSRCGWMFESMVIPSMSLRCPFCRKQLNGCEERDTIDDIIDWGKGELSKVDSNSVEGTVMVKLHYYVIEATLKYAVEGKEFSKTIMINDRNKINNLIDVLSLEKGLIFQKPLQIQIAQLFQKECKVQTKYLIIKE